MSGDDKMPYSEVAAFFDEFLQQDEIDKAAEAQRKQEARARREDAIARCPIPEPEPSQPGPISIDSVADSPIEAMLLRAIISRSAADIAPAGSEHLADARGFRLFAQLPIDRYVADIALVSPFVKVVVECDGKEFHDSPEQVQRDRKRDRAIVARGWRVIRFSGVEIHKSADACAAEVLEIFNAIHRGA